ncbi:hypothetical protein PROFUN_13783 [Planoprotostelium fungivorum]|uniref:Uncharacterized protein n=1 Tax=Planoprotostelium fungivorum TaxID=1890364 RepID=A0A2P6N347_9EUKA|nr:hypothetical protein PROFUN_13783 [Planoprotostelium fungivorum]
MAHSEVLLGHQPEKSKHLTTNRKNRIRFPEGAACILQRWEASYQGMCQRPITVRTICESCRNQKRQAEKRKREEENGETFEQSRFLSFTELNHPKKRIKTMMRHLVEVYGNEEEVELMLSFWSKNYGEKVLPPTESKITKNVQQLFESLPPLSPFRKPLINSIFQGFSPSEVKSICGVSWSTASRAQQLDRKENILLTQIYPNGVKLQIEDGFLDMCPVKSGDNQTIKIGSTLVAKHTQFISNAELYDQYVEAFKHRPVGVVSETYFLTLRPKQVRMAGPMTKSAFMGRCRTAH